MPILVVYGMPNSVEGLIALTMNLRSSVERFPDFELTTSQVSVFYPADVLQEDLGEELIMMIDGFFTKPNRTSALRDQWAKVLCHQLRVFAQESIPHCKKVEVIMRVFDPNFNAFASWEAPRA